MNDKMVNIYSTYLNRIISDSIVIISQLDKVMASYYFTSMNDNFIKSRIHFLKMKFEIYLKILRNINLTPATIPFAAEYVIEIRKYSKEINVLLEDILKSVHSVQSYCVNPDGNLISNVDNNE